MSLRKRLHALFGAIRFFTRLRVPGPLGRDGVALDRAIVFFPAAGLLIGGIAAAVFAGAAHYLPKTIAVAVALAAAIAVTGALHEDGWNDMVDGLVAGRDRGEILAIMRESTLGGYGGVALAVLLIARLVTLVEVDEKLIPAALVAGHAVSRLGATLLMSRLKYVRDEGKAKAFSNRLRTDDLVIASLSAVPPLFFLPFGAVFTGLLFAAGASVWMKRMLKRRLGGYTGDCLGATQQLAELAFYAGLLFRAS